MRSANAAIVEFSGAPRSSNKSLRTFTVPAGCEFCRAPVEDGSANGSANGCTNGSTNSGGVGHGNGHIGGGGVGRTNGNANGCDRYAAVTQSASRRYGVGAGSAMGANGKAPRSLEHALPTGSSATRADGDCRSCDVRGQARSQSPSCDVPISASQPSATRTRTPAARASSQHSSRTAAAQQPRHSCRVAGLWPDLSRKRAGTQPEVSWNSAKRYSAIEEQQRATESGRWHSSVERIRCG